MRLLAHKTEPELLFIFDPEDILMQNTGRINDWISMASSGGLQGDPHLRQADWRNGILHLYFYSRDALIAWMTDRWIWEYNPTNPN